VSRIKDYLIGLEEAYPDKYLTNQDEMGPDEDPEEREDED